MDRAGMEQRLRATLVDHRLSKGERQALQQVLAEAALSEADRAWLRSRAFAIAGEELQQPAREVLEWLEGVVKVLAGTVEAPRMVGRTAAYFSPGDPIPDRLIELIKGAVRTIDLCVFTITDDRLSRALLAAHEEGVKLRLITDDDKVTDMGSDIVRFARAGIPVAIDRGEQHMHNKYAIFDGSTLVTGSYNWTVSAAKRNDENILVTSDPRLVEPFGANFAALWRKYA